MPNWVQTLLEILIMGGLFGFIEFLIKRKDKKKDEIKKLSQQLEKSTKELREAFEKKTKELEESIEDIKQKSDENETHDIRTQLMLLIKLCPDDKASIFLVAEKYFREKNGDWYMTSVFNKWLQAEQVAQPEWFDPRK